mmetsp:Transcript_14857/g.27484  ORF Transcript_14857/g.27484 Transcript_14857/m.27484 type:complete len:480 (+) Transcript_14857:95-1534(+)
MSQFSSPPELAALEAGPKEKQRVFASLPPNRNRNAAIKILGGLVVLGLLVLYANNVQPETVKGLDGSAEIVSQSAPRLAPRQIVKMVNKLPGDIRQCNEEQAKFQGVVFEAAKVRGCPHEDDLWMRLVQMMMPEAGVFIDIGSNKGYTGARFFALWNPELGLTSKIHYRNVKQVCTYPEMLECGACGDCNDDTGPFIDMHKRVCGRNSGNTADPGKVQPMKKASQFLCQSRRDRFNPIRVFSFDGNKHLVEGLRDAIDYNSGPGESSLRKKTVEDYLDHSTPSNPGALIAQSWSVENRAFTETCAPGETLTFQLDGELGHIADEERDNSAKELKRQAKFGKVESVSVPCITVDQLIAREELEHIDILKVDTEGHDLAVLDGARQAIEAGKVSVILFEYNVFWPEKRKGEPALKAVVAELAQNDFACYLEGKNALVRLSYCWSNILATRQWSNIYCISTKNTEELVKVFDSYSLAFSSGL